MKKYSGKLYCFSPPVMLLTFLFEFGAALYVLWRYKMDTLTRLVVLMLLGLGTFQLAEYMVCGGLGVQAAQWTQLGYVSITLLPALGIHLIATIAGKKAPWIVGSAYATMVAVAAYFILTPHGINTDECRANYAVFDMNHINIYLYSIYYFGWLITGVFLSILWGRENAAVAPALRFMCLGYLSFMIPVAVVNIIDPSTMDGIPSIMCGFAVFLAIILVVFVLRKSKAALRRSNKSRKK